tara:strand:+ start:14090 stop:17479 length:3390 start_codon:yes stop_codon:yes gene_type:complete
MDKLTKYLIESILKENTKIKKIVGIYGGRFQPFGPHHLKTYKWLEKQVDEAYITTSNLKKPPRHPMNFKEKVRHMSKMGVKANRIVLEKSPYVANNLAKKYDSETTAFVYVFGAKDAGRLGGGGKYFQDYLDNKDNLKGHEENGYYLVAPHVSISVGGEEVSGTSMRALLGSPKVEDNVRTKLFKKMFGYFDKGIFAMMTNKFKKLFEIKENIKEFNIPIKVGDTVLMGKFKNKKVVVKSIDINDKGDMVINGKSASKFRLIKQPNIFDENINENQKIKKVLAKLKIPKTFWSDNRKLITYFQTNPQVLMHFLRLIGEDTIKESSTNVGYGADAGEPETGYVSPGKKRTIGKGAQPDNWYKKGGYEQLDFPVADDPYGDDTNRRISIQKVVNPDIYIDTIETDDYITTGVDKKGKNFVQSLTENVSSSQLSQVETYLDKLWGKVGVDVEFTRHFIDRINDTRNNKPISSAEVIRIFKQTYKKYGKQISKLGDDAQAVLKDMSTDVNVPFALHWNGSELEMRAKTIMRKKNFKSSNKKFSIEAFLKTIDINKIIKEANSTNVSIGGNSQGVDDGPSGFYGNRKTYSSKNEKLANKMGWKVVNLIIADDHNIFEPEPSTDYPNGPVGDVSFAPTGYTKNKVDRGEREDLIGQQAYTQYVKHINNVATIVGYKVIDYLGADKVSQHSLGQKEISKEKPKETNPNRKDIQEKIFSKEWWSTELLSEGGAYGHMAHPFDDKDLRFADLKYIIVNGLGGNLNREDGVTEKLDGQNLMVSWIDGSLRIARNKGHIKNFGKTSLDAKGIKSKFKGRGDIADAFNFAVKDLEKAIGSLSGKQQEKIFNNGKHWMNLEVMWPASANVIDYDVANIVFHGALIYDEKGNVRGEVKGSARILAGMIEQVNKHIGNKYSIGKPNFLEVPKNQDFNKLVPKFLSRLDKLKHQFGLHDSDTLGMYHQAYWEEYIYNAAQQFGYDIPDDILINLTKRWAFFDKSYKIPTIKTDLKEQPKFLEWVLTTDKNDHSAMVKENMKPFEILFFDVGAQILKNVEGYMSVSPDKAVQSMRKGISKAISDVKSGGDIKKMNKLKAQLEKLEAIGGMDAIVPSEGIVFKYQGKTYKFTGAFAPVNQIMGLITF